MRALAADAALAGLALAATLILLATGGFGTPGAGARHLDALGVALAVLSAAPLAARRRAPAVVFVASAAGSLALLALGYPLDAPVGTATAGYALAVAYSGASPPRRALALAEVNAFVPAVALAYASTGVRVWDITTELLAWAAVFAGLWVAGDRSRLRALRLAEAQEYARRVRADAERERRLAAADERTRIARELHDSAGHAINVILVQAGAARLLQQRDPDRARQALGTIETVARDTLTDIDRLVRALRDDHDLPADPGALGDLIARHRANGLAIAADLPEAVAPLPRSVAWAAYRILQEALTNASRHGAGSAEVAVRFRHDRVEIDVTNPTSPPPDPAPTAESRARPRPTDRRRTASPGEVRGAPAGDGAAPPSGEARGGVRVGGEARVIGGGELVGDEVRGGLGIVGMRERAAILGGSLRAAAGDGQFRLSAVLPYA